MIDFRHDIEKEKMSVLIENQTIHSLLAIVSGQFASLTSYAEIVDRNFIVTKDSYPRLYRLFSIAKEKLEIDENVLLFLANDYQITHKTVGSDNDYAIIISSACLEEYSDDELLAILGHELGHIGCGHVEYLELASLFDKLTKHIPGKISEIALSSAKAVLLNWLRTADYSADRAASIACNDSEVVIESLVKAIGGDNNISFLHYDYRIILENSRNEELSDDIGAIPQIIVQALMDESIVPFATARMNELKAWSMSDNCQDTFPCIYYNFIYSYENSNPSSPEMIMAEALAEISCNTQTALEKMHYAAKHANNDARYYLGKAYIEGKLIQKNYYIGIEYLLQATIQGHKQSAAGLAHLFEQGISGYINKDKAKSTWLKCYASGNAISTKNGYCSLIRTGITSFLKRSPLNNVSICDDYLSTACGFNEDNLRKELLIPQREILFAFQKNVGIQDFSLGISSSGLFIKERDRLPLFLPWEMLFKEEIVVQSKMTLLNITFEANTLYYGTKSDYTKSIIGLVIMIIKIAKEMRK